MLTDKVILFDDSCPMCRFYTWWFVVSGLLKPDHRIGFSRAPVSITSQLELNRARHEIPLFDEVTAKTVYGLDALTFILASRWRWTRPLFQTHLFRWLFNPLYQLITYNRRVISGCAACEGFDCAPDVNRFYRSVYLAMTASVVAGVFALLVCSTSQLRWIAAASVAAFVTLAILSGVITRISAGSVAGWNHIGNSATAILLIALVLMPVAVSPWIDNSVAVFLLLFAVVLGIYEFRRRGL